MTVRFNMKPKRGIEYLKQNGFVSASFPSAVLLADCCPVQSHGSWCSVEWRSSFIGSALQEYRTWPHPHFQPRIDPFQNWKFGRRALSLLLVELRNVQKTFCTLHKSLQPTSRHRMRNTHDLHWACSNTPEPISSPRISSPELSSTSAH